MTIEADRFTRTDEGNSERFAEQYEGRVLYCDDWKRWLIWDGRRWSEDHKLEVEQLAANAVKALLKEVAEIEDTEERDIWLRWASQSHSAMRQSAMLKLARSKLAVTPAQLDQNQWFLNCENGTLDLRTGKLKKHDPADRITKMMPVKWEPKATCPRFEKYLSHVMPDEEDRKFLQRAVGYSLTGKVQEHCMFVLWGSGRNGKSTFLALVEELLGDYSQVTDNNLFLRQDRGQHPEHKAELKGARFVIADEVAKGKKLEPTVVTSLTGGDTISARHLYGHRFSFKPTHKLWVGTNHKPIIDDNGPAIWSRIRLIPFRVNLPHRQRDKKLPEKLWLERSGILRWAVQGCLIWQKDGLGASPNVLAATREYRAEEDDFGRFLEERCVTGSALRSTTTDLHYEYQDWAAIEGIDRPMNLTAFGRTLTDRGFEKKRGGGGGETFRKGISVRKKMKLVRDED